jgi:hypothetical protein
MAGRATLIKSILASYPIHMLAALKVDKGTTKSFNKRCRSFMWVGKDEVSGG